MKPQFDPVLRDLDNYERQLSQDEREMRIAMQLVTAIHYEPGEGYNAYVRHDETSSEWMETGHQYRHEAEAAIEKIGIPAVIEEALAYRGDRDADEHND